MLDFMMLTGAIYVALVLASVTIMVVAASGWYIKKVSDMTKKMMDEFEKEE